MTASYYKPNRKGINDIAKSPEVRACLTQVAEKGKAFAEAKAATFVVTGDYEKSFEIRQGIADIAGAERAATRLVNTSAHAAAVEFGNKHTPVPHRTLGETAAALKSL